MKCLVVILLLLQVGCTGGLIAEVGSFKISKKDVEFRNQVIQIYYPNETRKLGRDQLVNAYITAQILINNGHALDKAVLVKERERIDKTTLMPEMLNRIK